ncbi:hypothetical protein M378DRAFT_88235, partial [Amanita muscaria Koide BX008]
MRRDVLLQDSITNSSSIQLLDQGGPPLPSVDCLTPETNSSCEEPAVSLFAAEVSLTAIDPSVLKADQFRAYDIITWHLERNLAGQKPSPLRMIIYGEGGTGKSKIIQTVTEAFSSKGVNHMLIKSAYTGVAASLIDGKTTYTLASLSLNKDGN